MFLIIIAIVVVIVLGLIAMYNNLVKLRMQTQETWSQIDVQLKRRNDLIPNLVETVKGYGKYEQETLEKVTELRSKVANAASPVEAMQASDNLSSALSRLIAVSEAYPDLKANQNYMKLQEELTNTENKISYSRQLYNSTVGNYNAKLQLFPTNIFAGMFGFQPAAFLETPAEEKVVPKVDFS